MQKEAENIAAGIERDTEWLEEHRKWKTMPSLTRNVVVSLIPVSYTHLDVYKRQGDNGIAVKSKDGKEMFVDTRCG